MYKKKNYYKGKLVLVFIVLFGLGYGFFSLFPETKGPVKKKVYSWFGTPKDSDTVSLEKPIIVMQSPLKGDTVVVPFSYGPDERTIRVVVKVCSVPIKFILDTGCSGVLLSPVEYAFLTKNGFLEDKPVPTVQTKIADGSTVEMPEIILDSLEIAGQILKDVKCQVADKQEAEPLLGQSVLGGLGTLQLDYKNKRILIIK